MSQNTVLDFKNISASNMIGDIDFRTIVRTHLAELNNISAVQDVAGMKLQLIYADCLSILRCFDRIDSKLKTFVMYDIGVLCQSGHDWIIVSYMVENKVIIDHQKTFFL